MVKAYLILVREEDDKEIIEVPKGTQFIISEPGFLWKNEIAKCFDAEYDFNIDSLYFKVNPSKKANEICVLLHLIKERLKDEQIKGELDGVTDDLITTVVKMIEEI